MSGWGVMVLAGALAAVAAGNGSAYTKHDYSKCKMASSDGIVETRVCSGYGGIPVRWIGGPDGEGVEFGTANVRDGLGADFSYPGETVEWRGPLRDGRVTPVAAIIRVEVLRSISGPVQRRLLVVHKLQGNRGSCIAAVVDAGKSNANVTARRIADQVVPGFRCGVDERQSL